MSVIVCLSIGIMLIMNVIKHTTLMTIIYVIILDGFALIGLLSGVFIKSRVSSAIIAIILMSVFTVFPISLRNEGFEALLLLLIQLFNTRLFGMEKSIGMNLYFTFLIVILFYTPFNRYIINLYTDNFMYLFQVLFIAHSFTAQFYRILLLIHRNVSIY